MGQRTRNGQSEGKRHKAASRLGDTEPVGSLAVGLTMRWERDTLDGPSIIDWLAIVG